MNEREAMTLTDASKEIRQYADNNFLVAGCVRRWADAIDAHLRAAEPVYQVRYVIMGIAKEWFEVCRDDFEKLDAFRCDDIVTQERRILYTHPPEPARDAKDGVLRFAGKVLSASRDNMADVDGGSIQDWAYECGLLESHQLSEDAPDEDRCDWCDGGECECFRYTALGKQCAAMAQESPDAK